MICPSESSGILSTRSCSIASAQAAASSLASAANDMPVGSDGDINAPFPLHDLVLLEPQVLVADMSAVGQMKLVAVPGTHDVHVVVVVSLAEKDAAFADQIDDLGHLNALA